MASRIIAHVDMDAFFAAIEEREHPEWKGKPIVVGADPEGGRGRGVVSTANYKAREFGIRSAMPISLAWRKCPYAVFVRPRRLYGEVSRKIMTLLVTETHRFGGKVEVVSVDEAYLQWNFEIESWAEAEARARTLKRTIWEQEQLTCSIGIGPNKLIAKIASDFQKPDGLTVIRPEFVEEFLEPLAVRALRGVGPKAEEALRKRNVKTVADLQTVPEETLVEWFGVFGSSLYRQARGLDDREVREEPEAAKSIGRQITFANDIVKPGLTLAAAIKLAEKVHRDVLEEGVRFKTITVTCRYAGFETHTKARTLKAPTQELNVLKAQVMKLLWPFLGRRPLYGRAHRALAVRLVGVRVGGLIS